MRLETERLLLRSLQREDIDRLVELWSDPDVTRFLGGPRDPERVRSILEEELAAPPHDRFGQWPLIEKESGATIGDCGLTEKTIRSRAEIELVYVLSHDAWGKGYATEIGEALIRLAFDELGLKRVVSLIDVGNSASKRVAMKLGMSMESVVPRPDGIDRELWVVQVGGA